MNAHVDNAEKLAAALAKHPKVKQVIFPGHKDHPQFAIAEKQMSRPGNLIAVEVEGGKPGAFKLANALELVTISNNLGDAKTLITHPATTTHQNPPQPPRNPPRPEDPFNWRWR